MFEIAVYFFCNRLSNIRTRIVLMKWVVWKHFRCPHSWHPNTWKKTRRLCSIVLSLLQGRGAKIVETRGLYSVWNMRIYSFTHQSLRMNLSESKNLIVSICTLYETWCYILPQDGLLINFPNNWTRFKFQIPECTVECYLEVTLWVIMSCNRVGG